MKAWLIGAGLMVGMLPAAQGSQLAACKTEVTSTACASYLEGMVDGVLLYKPKAVGARLDSDDYASRALKYRGGKRYQEANRQYCLDRLPERNNLVMALVEGFESGTIVSQESLEQAVFSLVDCQRMN
ncbi:hypothetical protein JYB87_05550 [Shewanella avicenniae]|uniref:Rap1a immunity protein domain-containing protein n=1 Tax=Shewanella avicenniae TaxID=2814294 RepID=A0ABX7QUJ3_9GAMM|nr:hypothetical protein [Shewanella avicenniae]QSX34702.1 hypothetical protein JYB87_05550 [Shewanella avicenniae]